MIARVVLPLILLATSPAFAQSDELQPIPALTMIGHPYFGEAAASRILFINARSRPVLVTWVDFDGGEHTYATLAPGAQVMQPTYVAHRWIIEDYPDRQPLEAFISTRSATDDGGAQIALIR